jgi:uncharacterized protein (TIGR00255 family)
MIRSMTGFGRASGEVGAKYFVTVAAKSVNHRYLETSVRVPEVLWEMEQPIRSLAAEIFSRGKVDVSVRSQRIHEPDYSVRINRRVADAVIPQVKTIADELGVDSRFTVADLLRIPDLLEVQPTDADLNESERADLLAIVRDAFQQLLANRKREGEALREDIATRTRNVRETGKSVAALRPQVQEEALNSYRERVAELAQSAGVTVPEERIAQEVVLQVEKGDIAEEITRLEIHLREVEKLLDSP